MNQTRYDLIIATGIIFLLSNALLLGTVVAQASTDFKIEYAKDT
ncbi:MAG: hypothetical protein ACUVQ5_06320 [Candidatus Methanomethylicaceae archaeon]